MDAKDVIYANGFQLTVGPAEVQLMLRLETPVVDPVENTLIRTEYANLADIRISPFIAKQLCVALSQNIVEYEKVFGEIIVPVKEEIAKEK